ncbi:MBL fold metallo-hydrolase [Pseudomonas sp. SMSB3]|uniref:MBL fold metallo-hydrolase n=1 Tax=Pseudomonas sp. SMSB3 TaxID=3390196 RepID=UPI003F87F673
MPFPCISHHGGTEGVTGSCHQLHLNPMLSLLVDCGLAQGSDARPGTDAEPVGFEINGICALIVTHVHLDHVGRIPALLAAGYRGPVICSEPSAALLPLVLEDAYRLTISNDSAHIEHYLGIVRALIVPLAYDRWHFVVQRGDLSCAIRLRCAGHLLGSSYVECDVRSQQSDLRIVFSGDIGPHGNPLLNPVQPPERADVLVLESTYGDRLHPPRDCRREQLEHLIDRALQDRGTILIPAFSLGRTQELLFEIEDILHQKALVGDPHVLMGADAFRWSQLPIILDSPLAQRITAVYRQLHQHWNEQARTKIVQGRDPLGFGQLVTVDSHSRHLQVVNYLRSTGRPAIVIAGNGMCSGGRIVRYLKAMLPEPRHEVMFVGYQVKGTPGAAIQASQGAQGPGRVELDGEFVEIQAKVMTMSGYSGHADQAGLSHFALCTLRPPSRIVLVHGTAGAKSALRDRLIGIFESMGREVAVSIP